MANVYNGRFTNIGPIWNKCIYYNKQNDVEENQRQHC